MSSLADKVRKGVLTRDEAMSLLDKKGARALAKELAAKKPRRKRRHRARGSMSEQSVLLFWRLEDVKSRQIALGVLDRCPDWVSESFPPAPSPEQALSRAASVVRLPGILFRKRRGSARGMVAVISDDPTQKNLVMEHGATVVPTATGAGILEMGGCEKTHREAAQQLIEEQERQLDRLDPLDVSQWLSATVSRHCGGIALRAKGGVYAVPPSCVGRLDTLRKAAERFGAELYILRVGADRATQAAMRAAQKHGLAAICREAFSDTEVFVQEASDRERPKRGASSAVRKLLEARERVELYNQVLGSFSTNLADKIEEAETAARAAYHAVSGKELDV